MPKDDRFAKVVDALIGQTAEQAKGLIPEAENEVQQAAVALAKAQSRLQYLKHLASGVPSPTMTTQDGYFGTFSTGSNQPTMSTSVSSVSTATGDIYTVARADHSLPVKERISLILGSGEGPLTVKQIQEQHERKFGPVPQSSLYWALNTGKGTMFRERDGLWANGDSRGALMARLLMRSKKSEGQE